MPIIDKGPDERFAKAFDLYCEALYLNSQSKGFWVVADDLDNAGIGTDSIDDIVACEKIALMHSELSEALEAVRNHNPPDTHCPEFSSLEIELADTVIRIMDYAHYRELRLGEAIYR